MNNVNLIGRLTKDIELRYSQDGMAIGSFALAIDRPPRKDGTKEADFPRITCFGKVAENCEKYTSKGSLVGVTGRIQTDSYTNKDGNTVYTTDVVASYVQFLNTKGGNGNHENIPADGSVPAGFEAISDDDIPF